MTLKCPPPVKDEHALNVSVCLAAELFVQQWMRLHPGEGTLPRLDELISALRAAGFLENQA